MHAEGSTYTDSAWRVGLFANQPWIRSGFTYWRTLYLVARAHLVSGTGGIIDWSRPSSALLVKHRL